MRINKVSKTKEVERFWSRVNRLGVDDCWVWVGRINPDGYGMFDYGNRGESSHRYVWRLFTGEDIPSGMVICHKCDNPPCCNPNHLFLGTVQDNVKDRDSKGRQRSHKGSDNNRAVLNEDKVRKIKQLRKDGMEYQKIADFMGVSNGCVNHIINGRHWGWVTLEESV